MSGAQLVSATLNYHGTLPELTRLFQHPDSTAQRHYEICRAYFLEHCTANELAQRFGLHVGSIRVVVRDFAHHPDLGRFFRPKTLDKPAPKRAAIRDRAVVLRQQGHTLADIRTHLQADGHTVSEAYLFRLLQEQGLIAKGQRCRAASGASTHANDGSLLPAMADVQQLTLEPGRHFSTKVAGLFLFLPALLALNLPQAVGQAGLPGSEQIPPLQAFLALLLPKLLGHRRISHISDLCADEGAGLWAGLNVLPKTTYATDYSYRTERTRHERLVAAVMANTALGEAPHCFNLDFHAIPFRGHEPDLEQHWVPLRNRALPAVMAFVAQLAGRRIMCYATANVLRADADSMVPRFAKYWKEETGQYPARLLFDSRTTTYEGLHTLNQAKVGFITIRRRGSSMLARIGRLPASSWQRCQIVQAKGKRRQVSYVDEMVQLDDYEGEVRQVVVTGLGHATPTFFLTNDRPERQTAREVIQTYASRNHIENRVGSSRVDLQACKLEYSIVSPK